jgi:hypothetical protein
MVFPVLVLVFDFKEFSEGVLPLNWTSRNFDGRKIDFQKPLKIAPVLSFNVFFCRCRDHTESPMGVLVGIFCNVKGNNFYLGVEGGVILCSSISTRFEVFLIFFLQACK